MNDAHALAALAAWGASGPVRLVAARENCVYAARLTDGRRAALRLHRTGYRPAQAIEAELAWAARLAEAGVACPVPVATAEGGWIARAPDGRLASVVTWVDGAPIAADPARFVTLGRALGRFHRAADALSGDPDVPPLGAFPKWDAEALVGTDPLWGRFWESPALTPGETTLLQEARAAIQEWLMCLGAPDTGLIHGDLLPDNVLDTGRAGDAALTLIDFDDCGAGYRAYDLATALIAHARTPRQDALQAALGQGYAETRPEAAPVLEHVPGFVAIRALASCGWAASRTGASDPRRRAYAERALALARRWLSDGPPVFRT